MRILICDDHLLLAEALSAVLRGRGHETLADVTRPEEAVAAVRASQVDVCVMDLGFPGGDGIDGIRRLRRASPSTRVVVLSALDDPAAVEEALAAGASGYVLKGEPTEAVVRVIERVAAGETGIAPAPEALATDRGADGSRLGRFLTRREREVLERLVRGQSTTAMAREMGVAYSTVRTHIQNVLTKLGVHSKLAAVTLAAQQGLVRLGPDRPLPVTDSSLRGTASR
jgi:two-component system nitrate/nitrite response regulator NarL